MPEFRYDFDPVDHITVGAVVQLTRKVYYLQARQGHQLVSVTVEIAQVLALVQAIEELLEKLGKQYHLLNTSKDALAHMNMALEEPIKETFQVGQIGLGYDNQRDLVVIIVQDLLVSGSTQTMDVVRLSFTRNQARALARQGAKLGKDSNEDVEGTSSNVQQPANGLVFISYAREDQDFVLKLVAQLQKNGVNIWIDQWSIRKGADWDQAIDQALYGCRSFLIILSPAAVASSEVRAELRVALNEGKHILPILYKPCRIPRQLLLLEYVNFTSLDAANTAGLRHIIDALDTLA